MRQFRSIVYGLVGRTQKLLFDKLLLYSSVEAKDVPAVQWDALRDNPSNTTPGWSFLDDQRSKFAVNSKDWLFRRIRGHEKLRKAFERTGSKSGLNQGRVKEYISWVARFREQLFVAMHITGGQPARGSEILSLRCYNTWKGGHRNVFIEDGIVVFMTEYHKGYALSGDVKVVHRYLPREIGALLI